MRNEQIPALARLLLICVIAVVGCVPARVTPVDTPPDAAGTTQPAGSPEVQTLQSEPSALPPTQILRLVLTATATVQLPLRPGFTTGVEGRYSAEQIRRIAGGAFTAQEEALSHYYQYWLGADPASRPVYPAGPEAALNFDYVFNPEDPGDACVAIPAIGYGLQLMSVPYVNGEPVRAAPSRYVNGGIETGQGPLLLARAGNSENLEGGAFVLGCDGGRWVRRDAANSGQVTERINQQNQWQVELARVAQNHGLNPERQYSEQTMNGARYLVDQHNGAKMLVWENGAWVDTSLEEKYGHLVPVNERMLLNSSNYNTWPYNSERVSGNDPQYRNTGIVVRLTGNIRAVTEPNLELGMDVINVYDQVVYRNSQGGLEIIRVRLIAADAASPKVNMLFCLPEPLALDQIVGHCGTNGIIRMPLQVAVDILNQPGAPYQLVFTDRRPAVSPPEYQTETYSNLQDRANYIDWLIYRDQWQALAESLRTGSGTNPYPDVQVGVSVGHPYITETEFRQLRNEYIDIQP